MSIPDQHDQCSVSSRNIITVQSLINTDTRERHYGHKSGILWLTGLSGAGKSTLAVTLEKQLFHKGYQVCVLDGDNIRTGLSVDLGFSPEDRTENIRRVGEVAKLIANVGFLVITAFISPYRNERDRLRTVTPNLFHEIYVKADLSICENRDPKGLYAMARRGEILDFTGISAPYEEPKHPNLTIDTGKLSIDASTARLTRYVAENFGQK